MSRSETIDVAAGTADAAWRGAGPWAVGLVAFPIVLTTGAAAAYVALAGRLPAMAGAQIYTLACWLAVAAAWRWSRLRGVRAQVFAFRPPAGRDWLGAVAGTAAGILMVWPASQWVAHLLGAPVRGMTFDLHQPSVLAIVVVWAIVTAPICEEILFRGLAVAYLQARGWPAWAVALASCVVFAAIHVPHFGLGLAIFILPWSGILMFLRLWRGSLTPGWMMHALNNVIAYLVIPWLVPRAAA
jgi:membrane protease YdiL (CAAX protease family)